MGYFFHFVDFKAFPMQKKIKETQEEQRPAAANDNVHSVMICVMF